MLEPGGHVSPVVLFDFFRLLYLLRFLFFLWYLLCWVQTSSRVVLSSINQMIACECDTSQIIIV